MALKIRQRIAEWLWPEAKQYRVAAEELWALLDHIDTLPDMVKPDDGDLKAWHRMWHLTEQRFQKRHEFLETDGYDLFLPGTMPKRPSPGKLAQPTCAQRPGGCDA